MEKERFFKGLRAVFNPSSVAVVGASEKPAKLGFHVMKSLTRGGYEGAIIPINPSSTEVMGIKAYPSLTEYPGTPDMAIIVVPAAHVASVLAECGKKSVKGVVLITAGFKEIDDPSGALLQKEVALLADSLSIPVIGPNTFGIVNLHARLNASFTPEFSLVRAGGVTLVSQSGGISHLLGFLAMKQGIGMAKIIGLGNRLNVDFADLLPFLAEDEETRAIALYIEGLDNPRPLLEEAKKLLGRKPVVAYKSGAGTRGDAASRSHTGSLAGRGEIYDGALHQACIVTVKSPQALLDAARVLASCPGLKMNTVAILTGQAGPGMAASDVCETEGMKIAVFSTQTQEKINALLPPLAMRTNPVDMGPAWYDARAIEGIVRAALDDEAVGGALILMMFASANRDVLPRIKDFFLEWKQKKPVITCFSAPEGIWDEDIRILEEAGAIVNFPTPERAASAMSVLGRYKTLTLMPFWGTTKDENHSHPSQPLG
ncbi:MAG: hypothetical protein CO107_14895 [Deltaproteobacteria bacterium CG_4_9_14_3_um_filter_51_14]|nr:hypothetical protein [bacterium]PJB33753.1 MAG: hypothetical protein CO107_14895 [Deltaproteobacteria bacterium CG_4_9_14_3_um_filter_51_14]